MVAITPKPELLDTITRRRRTVADFLETKNVSNLQELDQLLLSLEKDYIISDEFLKQSKELLEINPCIVTGALPPDESYIGKTADELNKKVSKKRSKKETAK